MFMGLGINTQDLKFQMKLKYYNDSILFQLIDWSNQLTQDNPINNHYWFSQLKFWKFISSKNFKFCKIIEVPKIHKFFMNTLVTS